MVCPPATSEAGIMSAKVVSCANINGYLRNYQDCLTIVSRQNLTCQAMPLEKSTVNKRYARFWLANPITTYFVIVATPRVESVKSCIAANFEGPSEKSPFDRPLIFICDLHATKNWRNILWNGIFPLFANFPPFFVTFRVYKLMRTMLRRVHMIPDSNIRQYNGNYDMLCCNSSSTGAIKNES
jgi:hypothetical protein